MIRKTVDLQTLENESVKEIKDFIIKANIRINSCSRSYNLLNTKNNLDEVMIDEDSFILGRETKTE